METGEIILLVGGAVGVVYLISRNQATAPPAAPPPAPLPRTTPVQGVGSSTPSFVTGAANAAGTGALIIGTGVGRAYLGPLGPLIGHNASIDTKAAVLNTYTTAKSFVSDASHGNVIGATTSLASGVVNSVKQPLTTVYDDLKSLNPF
jgi:hypothetical protein